MPTMHQTTSGVVFGHEFRIFQFDDDNLMILQIDDLFIVGMVNEMASIVIPNHMPFAASLEAAEQFCDLLREPTEPTEPGERRRSDDLN